MSVAEELANKLDDLGVQHDIDPAAPPDFASPAQETAFCKLCTGLIGAIQRLGGLAPPSAPDAGAIAAFAQGRGCAFDAAAPCKG